MYNNQSCIGSMEKMKNPKFTDLKLARVSKVEDRFVEVTLLGSSTIGGVTVPSRILTAGFTVQITEGDVVLVAYVDSLKTNPVIVAFLKGDCFVEDRLKVSGSNVEVNTVLNVINDIFARQNIRVFNDILFPNAFGSLLQELTRLSSGVEELRARVTSLETRATSLETRATNLEARVTAVEARV